MKELRFLARRFCVFCSTRKPNRMWRDVKTHTTAARASCILPIDFLYNFWPSFDCKTRTKSFPACLAVCPARFSNISLTPRVRTVRPFLPPPRPKRLYSLKRENKSASFRSPIHFSAQCFKGTVGAGWSRLLYILWNFTDFKRDV